MSIEQALAAQKISAMRNNGYPIHAAIMAAKKLVKSQGFSDAHAKETAEKMAELVY